MADRIFKGELVAEKSPAFPEASQSFDGRHAGGLNAFDMFKEVLQIESSEAAEFKTKHPGWVTTSQFKVVNGTIFMSRGDIWIQIKPNGSIEVGISGA